MGSNSLTSMAASIVIPSMTTSLAAVTSALISSSFDDVQLISPTIYGLSVISTSPSSLLSTQIPPSPRISPAVTTIYVTLTPAPIAEIPTACSTSSLSNASNQPAVLVGLTAGRLENGSTSTSSPLLRGSATALGADSTPTPTGLSTAGILVSSKQKTVGPFAPGEAILGGIPTTSLDVPLTVVFLILFLIGAAIHFSIHEFNGKRGHKFHLSDAVFDFCMVRTVTCTMRIVWAFRPTNNSVVLAALIFENAGVVVLFAVNVIFTQRIIRALHPALGWHPIFSSFITTILISVPMIIVWNIVNLTVSFFTLNPDSIRVTHDLLLFGSCWTLFLSLFPILFIGFLAPSNPMGGKIEKFGLGSFTAKLIILLSASALLFVGALVRLIAAVQPHPIDAPGPIDSKTVFYLTGFTLEIIVVYLYAISRIDLRFWVPNGCTQPGDYLKAKSGFKLPSEDEEALFQEVDFKMRFSSGSNLPRDSKPQGTWANGGGIPTNARWRPFSASRFQSEGGDGTHATREQVRQAIWDLKLNSELVGQPVEVGNGEELLVYAFRCRKGDLGDGRRPLVGDRLSSSGSASPLVRASGIRLPIKASRSIENWAARDRENTGSSPEREREMI